MRPLCVEREIATQLAASPRVVWVRYHACVEQEHTPSSPKRKQQQADTVGVEQILVHIRNFVAPHHAFSCDATTCSQQQPAVVPEAAYFWLGCADNNTTAFTKLTQV